MKTLAWLINPGVLWLLLLITIVSYTTAMQRRSRHREERIERVVRRVDAMLTVWANHWGEPAADVKEQLQAVIRK